jgi:hypothetical protein
VENGTFREGKGEGEGDGGEEEGGGNVLMGEKGSLSVIVVDSTFSATIIYKMRAIQSIT